MPTFHCLSFPDKWLLLPSSFYSVFLQYLVPVFFYFFFQKENVGGDPNADFSVGRTGSIILEFLILSSTIG